MGFNMFSRAQLSPLCLSPVKMFNLVRLSIRLLNISTTNYKALYKQAPKPVLSKIKPDNSPGPMWLEHMCSINIFMIIIIIIKAVVLGCVCVCFVGFDATIG